MFYGKGRNLGLLKLADSEKKNWSLYRNGNGGQIHRVKKYVVVGESVRKIRKDFTSYCKKTEVQQLIPFTLGHSELHGTR